MGSDNPDNVVGWIRQYATKEWLPKNPHPTETQVDAEVARILKHCRVDDDSMRSWTNEGNEAAFFGKGPDVSAQMNRRLMQRDMLQGAYASAFRNTVRDYAIVSEPSPTAPTVTSTATISRANAAATPNQQVVPSPTLSDQEIQQSRMRWWSFPIPDRQGSGYVRQSPAVVAFLEIDRSWVSFPAPPSFKNICIRGFSSRRRLVVLLGRRWINSFLDRFQSLHHKGRHFIDRALGE
jgi:hypothetical protein